MTDVAVVVDSCSTCDPLSDLLPVLFFLFDKGGIPRSLWDGTLVRWKELFEHDEPRLWLTLERIDRIKDEVGVVENPRRPRTRSRVARVVTGDNVACGVARYATRRLWFDRMIGALDGYQLRFSQRRLQQLVTGLRESHISLQ
jgi:hypothetical protein